MSLTLSAIAVGAVKCAAAGGCLSVVQYVNTSRTLANQNKLAAEGREHSEKLQKLQQEFQEKLQERNLVETERIQREIVALQHKYAKALLDENFSKQWDLIQEQVNLERAWPLILPAKHYVEQLKMRTREGRFPLQIIVASSPNASFQLQTTEIGTVLSRTYGTDVFYFDGAWKSGMSAKSAQMLQLQKNLGGCPTIVIKPDIVDGKFIFEMAYWGIADFSSPAPAIITKLSMRDINLNALRQFADEKAAMYETESAPSPFKELISLREEENNTYDSYIKQHGSDVCNAQENLIAKAQEYCNDLYRTRYQSLSSHFEANIIDIRDKYFYSLIGVATAVMVDVHRMLEYHEKPLGATLPSLFNGITEKEWASLMASTYMDVLGRMSEDIFYELPLYYALVASYFNGLSEGKEYAIGFAEAGWKRLHALYPFGKNIDTETHKKAFHTLSEVDANPFLILDNTTMNIEQLNESIADSNQKIDESVKTLFELCSKQGNGYDLDAAREILAESLEETLASLKNVELSDLDKHKSDLMEAIENCRNGRFKIAVIGEYQSGKTTTANAICGGRYVAPMGSGVKTSAMPVIFSYSESESVTIHWKSAKEFPVVFQTLALYVKDFDWSNFDLDNRTQRELLLKELESKRNEPTVSTNHWQFFVLGSMILTWYGTPDLEEYKKKSITFADVQVLGKFSEDMITRWRRNGIASFTLEESLFPLIRVIECKVCSDLLSSMHCVLIDCPGLFANDYDTAVTRAVMDKANAILYLLPYHKAISEDGVGANLVRLKDDYKDLAVNKLMVANNLQFSSPNADAIEKANKDKVSSMFGEGLSFVVYDARLAFISQLYLSHSRNSITPETEQRFIAEAKQSESSRSARYLRNCSTTISDLEGAVQRVLSPYGLPNSTNPLEVYTNSGMSSLLEELNRFVSRNEAYSILVTEGIDKLRKKLEELKSSIQLTHIEPYTSDLSNLEALWKRRELKAEKFSDKAYITVRKEMMGLKETLVNTAYSEVFTPKFYDSLYKRIALEIYDFRWDIISCYFTFNIKEGRENAKVIVKRVSTRILENVLNERFEYVNNLLVESRGTVGVILNPVIKSLNMTLSCDWAREFVEDKSFSANRAIYYSLPSRFGQVSDAGKIRSTAGVDDGDDIIEATKYTAAVGVLVLAVSMITAAVVGSICAIVTGIVLDVIATGGLVSISTATATFFFFLATGYGFKEAFVKTKEKLDSMRSDAFVGKVVKKLSNDMELADNLNKEIRRSLNELTGGLLTKYCSGVRLNKELLEQHAEDALTARRNGSSAALYNNAIIVFGLIDKLLKSYNTCLEKLIELPSVSKKLGS